MGAFMYPIRINYKRAKKHYSRQIELGDEWLSLADLQKHLQPGEKFRISTDEWGEMTMTIFGTRLETLEERNARVESAKKYNANREEFLKKSRTTP